MRIFRMILNTALALVGAFFVACFVAAADSQPLWIIFILGVIVLLLWLTIEIRAMIVEEPPKVVQIFEFKNNELFDQDEVGDMAQPYVKNNHRTTESV